MICIDLPFVYYKNTVLYANGVKAQDNKTISFRSFYNCQNEKTEPNKYKYSFFFL